MDIWIILDGEKSGPVRDYEIRGRIESGELAADTPAWHEGLESWRPLGEISLFAREFERLKGLDAEPAPPSMPAPGDDRPSAVPKPHLVRRFWARWFDLYLYSGVWWIALWAAGRDIGAVLQSPWTILLQYVPWFALEAILLHRFGTTPGKWLLGIKVLNDGGGRLNLAAATRRSVRVLFLGIGLGWGMVALVCQIMAFFTTRRLGRPLWDQAGGHRLAVDPLSPLRLATYVIGLFAALQLQMIVVAPYVMENMRKTFPSLREQIDRNPPWHLPQNR
jgi:uncharacterized RDD family membrane protein YckC